jgi:hypothetical protein
MSSDDECEKDQTYFSFSDFFEVLLRELRDES